MNLKNCRVLVTPTSFGKNDPRLRPELEGAVGEVIYNEQGRPLTSAEVRSLLPGCDGFIAGLDAIDGAALESADRLKVIARYGVGVDNIDLESARRRAVIVTNTPQANSTSVAELAIGLMLSLARFIPQACAEVKAGEWPRYPGRTLQGKIVGLIGFGSIGKEVARRLFTWDCTVLAFDPKPDLKAAGELRVQLSSLASVLARADIVTLHVPAVYETAAMVDAAFLSAMKPGSFLVNTARGELIDEAALLGALESGRLAGAALDAFSKQPPDPDSTLLRLRQVITTPHCGAHTDGAMDAMGWGALRNCLRVLRGELPDHPVQ
jgi:D-3-phosphoglycerate dehydrogenase / 2-oxoglutarate reductase